MGVCGAVLLLLPVSLNGATVSLLAFQFQLAGILVGMALFVLAALLCVFAGWLIQSAALEVGAVSFHELARLTLGRRSPRCGRCVSAFSAALNCVCLMGAAVAAIVFTKNVAAEAARGLPAARAGVLHAPSLWACAGVFGGVLPGLACPRLGCLKAASLLAGGLVLGYAGVAAWGLFAVAGLPAALPPQPALSLGEARAAFTLFLYPLLVHPNLLPVFAQLRTASLERASQVLVLDAGLVLSLYSLIGVFGCLSVAGSRAASLALAAQQNLFRVRSAAAGAWLPNQLFSLLFLASSLSLALACLFPLKLLLLDALPPRPSAHSHACRAHLLAALLLSLILCSCALALDKTSLAIRLVGLGCYPLSCFVLPALFYLALPSPRLLPAVGAVCLLLFFLALMLSALADLFS